MAESKKAPKYGSPGRPSMQGSNTARIPGANSQMDTSGSLPTSGDRERRKMRGK